MQVLPSADRLKVMESDLWFRITVISAGVLTVVLMLLLILMK